MFKKISFLKKLPKQLSDLFDNVWFLILVITIMFLKSLKK